jgi:hypothetical protein
MLAASAHDETTHPALSFAGIQLNGAQLRHFIVHLCALQGTHELLNDLLVTLSAQPLARRQTQAETRHLPRKLSFSLLRRVLLWIVFVFIAVELLIAV